MKKLIPYGPAASTTIDGLTFETDEGSLVISGSVEARRDAAGLKSLEDIMSILQEAIADLRSQDLPKRSDGPLPDGPTVSDPFS